MRNTHVTFPCLSHPWKTTTQFAGLFFLLSPPTSSFSAIYLLTESGPLNKMLWNINNYWFVLAYELFVDSKSHTKMLIRTQWYQYHKKTLAWNLICSSTWHDIAKAIWGNRCSPCVFASSLWIHPPFECILSSDFSPTNLIVQYPSHGLPLQMGTNKRYEYAFKISKQRPPKLHQNLCISLKSCSYVILLSLKHWKRKKIVCLKFHMIKYWWSGEIGKKKQSSNQQHKCQIHFWSNSELWNGRSASMKL